MKENPNIELVERALKRRQPMGTKEICAATELSPDQVRRALKSLPVCSPSRGVYELNAKPTPMQKLKTKTPNPKVSITSICNQAIKDGKSNDQILSLLTKKIPGFDPEKKKHYPGWFRAKAARDRRRKPARKK